MAQAAVMLTLMKTIIKSLSPMVMGKKMTIRSFLKVSHVARKRLKDSVLKLPVMHNKKNIKNLQSASTSITIILIAQFVTP